MTIDVAISAEHVLETDVRNKTVIVIDVLRATSVMITALENGAEKIIPVQTIKEVFNKAKQNNSAIKAGERHAEKVEGFDLGNSPLEYTRARVKDKTIVLSTTNGTRALLKTREANMVFIGAFLNVNAVAKAAHKIGSDILILCAGTHGKLSLDDALCAGAIINAILQNKTTKLTDIAWMHYNLYTNNNKIETVLRNCSHYQLLKQKGFNSDIDYCIQLNTSTLVPIWDGENIRIV
jgi:2-phosphosulfolactate phosphatase